MQTARRLKKRCGALSLNDAEYYSNRVGLGKIIKGLILRSLLLTLATATGCKTNFFLSSPQTDPTTFERSEATQAPVFRAIPGSKLTFAFNGVPLRDACEEISDASGVDVFCSGEVAETTVSGYFSRREPRDVLPLLATANGLRCVETRGAYVLTSLPTTRGAGDDFLVSRVYRMPPGDERAVESALRSALTKSGEINIVGSSFVVRDTLATQDSISDLVDALAQHQSSVFLCDVYFLRLKYNDYLNLSAKLEVDSSLDLLEGGFDFDELFSLYADGDLKNGKNRVDQRPALLLTDGQETKLEVGSEIVREKKQVSSEGYSSTSGYEKFQDGVVLTLRPRKMGGECVALDVDLSISTFDQSTTGSDSSAIPRSDKASIVTKGLIVRDSKMNYIGSIDRRDESKGLGLFSVSRTRNSDVLTIWARIREVKN